MLGIALFVDIETDLTLVTPLSSIDMYLKENILNFLGSLENHLRLALPTSSKLPSPTPTTRAVAEVNSNFLYLALTVVDRSGRSHGPSS